MRAPSACRQSAVAVLPRPTVAAPEGCLPNMLNALAIRQAEHPQPIDENLPAAPRLRHRRLRLDVLIGLALAAIGAYYYVAPSLPDVESLRDVRCRCRCGSTAATAC
jgi:hypothetical protein